MAKLPRYIEGSQTLLVAVKPKGAIKDWQIVGEVELPYRLRVLATPPVSAALGVDEEVRGDVGSD